MDTFQRRALKTYYDVTVEFLEFLKAQTADGEDAVVDDMMLFLNNLVLHDEAKMVEGAENWVENMLEPLHPKRVKYAKALDRILASERADGDAAAARGIVLHAAHYHDLDAMITSSSSDTFQQLDLKARCAEWSKEALDTLWQYFDELNRTAFAATKRAAPRVPTRDEIVQNIKSKRGADGSSSGVSMHRAFVIAYNALRESRGSGAPPMTDEGAAALKADAVAKLDAEALGVIQARDDAARARVAEAFPELEFERGEAPTKTEWDLATQLCTLCRVESAVPSNVMQNVESFAQKLASDMMSGRRDLSSFQNIEAIGEELMANIDPSDIAKLTDGVDALLPALNMLKGSL